MPHTEKLDRAQKPDAQAFDEIRLVTVPRYKTSGLSGDEWRIKVNFQFYRKGKLILEDFAGHDMNSAVRHVDWKYVDAVDNGNGYFAGEEDFCDQEGCSNQSTVTYKLKKKYCKDGHPTDPYRETIRKFCETHKRRGDCGLEDSDANYELISSPLS